MAGDIMSGVSPMLSQVCGDGLREGGEAADTRRSEDSGVTVLPGVGECENPKAELPR